MNLGPPELLILLIIVLVLFGGAKLPKLAKSLGEAQKEFKRSSEANEEEAPSTVSGTVTPTPPKDETPPSV